MQRLTRRQALRLGFVSVLAAAVASCGPGQSAPGTPSAASTPPGGSGSAEATPTAAAPNIATKEAEGLNISGAPLPSQPLGAGTGVSVTSNKDFYTVAITQKTDWLSPAAYKLLVAGEVANALALSLDDLKAMTPVTQMRTLECISNPVGGNLISNAIWRGVRLAEILEKAGLKSTAIEIKFTSADGYSTSIPISTANDENSLLVYEMNGVPLPDDHGAPLRALFAGRYGMKQPKWITRIDAITQPYLGHWEKQGWSNEAIIKVNSQIRMPQDGEIIKAGAYAITGVAFSNTSGVEKLELSFDGGDNWTTATLVRGPTALTWSEWRYQWQTPSQSTRINISARATDGFGNRQEMSRSRLLLPDSELDGVSAIHVVPVRIEQ